jgi:copper chaperone CopZ
VTAVQADASTHTVTVSFDDAELELDAVVEALGEAGYSVPRYELLD